jgi:HK97 family phage prohead protease
MNKIETKSYSFSTDNCSWEEVETKAGKKFYVTGYISTKDIDLYNELVTEGAMKEMLEDLKTKSIKLDVEHEAWRKSSNTIPIGKIVDANYDGYGIFVKAEINNSSPVFKEVWGSIKEGYLDAFSIAYKALKKVTKVVNGVTVTLLKSLELLNVAITGNPVNPKCRMTNVFMKSLEDLEELKMTEEKQETPKEEAPVEAPVEAKEAPVEAPKEAPVEEKPAEAPVEAPAEKPAEAAPVEEKSVDIKAELKSRDDIIAELKSKVEELEKVINKPQMKALAEETPAVVEEAGTKINSPLELIH